MSGQKFIARNRAPRVLLEYSGSMFGATKANQLPFVIGVMADLGGAAGAPAGGVEDRRFFEIDADNFDERLKALLPRVAFSVSNTLAGAGLLAVELGFASMDDFSPPRVANGIGPLRGLSDARERLSNLVIYMDGKAAAEELCAKVLADRPTLDALATAEPGAIDPDLDSSVRATFKPQSERARAEVVLALQTLARRALESAVSVGSDVVESIHALVAEIDRSLSTQLNLVLHHPDFQELEGRWRGLHYLVNNTETDELVKVRVLNISKRELAKTLRKFKGAAWDQSPIFKKLYEDEFGQLGGEPFGCIVGDFYFDQSPPDVELLGELGRIMRAMHAPLLAAAAPSLFQLGSWQELGNPRNLDGLLSTPEYAAWRSLRDSDEARCIGLTVPRFLARLPYGARTNPVEQFDFEEETGGSNNANYTWANAAYAMAVNVARAFRLYGWCARIRGVESGGGVEGLPVHVFPTDDGGVDTKCPTEVAITDRREAELAKQGLMPLIHRKNSDFAVFIGAQSLQRTAVYDDPEATANAALGARLPYLFVTGRFAQYLMCIARDQIGAFTTREHLQASLQGWISQYVDADLQHSSEESKAKKPLAAAEVVVEETVGNPGAYTAKLFVLPHYQLEGLTTSLRLVMSLPSAKAG